VTSKNILQVDRFVFGHFCSISKATCMLKSEQYFHDKCRHELMMIAFK